MKKFDSKDVRVFIGGVEVKGFYDAVDCPECGNGLTEEETQWGPEVFRCLNPVCKHLWTNRRTKK